MIILSVYTFSNIGLFSEILAAKFDSLRNCSEAWNIPCNNGPKLHRMMTLTAKDAHASTNLGSPTLKVYARPAANRTAILRSVSAKTC
jgi:hypothetical protein